jgi:hypothetical protein
MAVAEYRTGKKAANSFAMSYAGDARLPAELANPVMTAADNLHYLSYFSKRLRARLLAACGLTAAGDRRRAKPKGLA